MLIFIQLTEINKLLFRNNAVNITNHFIFFAIKIKSFHTMNQYNKILKKIINVE